MQSINLGVLIMIKAIAIIPAKTDSKRLKKKNLRIINNKTLVEHAIDYAKNSKLIKHIVVTTESDEVRLITKKYENIILRDREKSYMGEREVADVYVNVMQELEPQLLSGITHVVGIQPDHPDRRTKVDDLLEMLAFRLVVYTGGSRQRNYIFFPGTK